MSDPTLQFSEAAAQKVRALLDEEDNQNLKLRVFVTGGGCSGFQYGFTFDENQEEGDTRVDRGGVTLLVDPMSVQYLLGAEIDYKEDVQGAQFVIRNPNAATTCGCGNSFSV
jgi:iron-sulfur cluster insertion protein